LVNLLCYDVSVIVATWLLRAFVSFFLHLRLDVDTGLTISSTMGTCQLDGNTFALRGSSLPCTRCANANLPQRRIDRLFSPFSRNNGGASHTSRRFFAINVRNTAALPVLPARHCGCNLRIY
jgi:hypothetical protein